MKEKGGVAASPKFFKSVEEADWQILEGFIFELVGLPVFFRLDGEVFEDGKVHILLNTIIIRGHPIIL